MASKGTKKPKRGDGSGRPRLGSSFGFWCSLIVAVLIVLYVGLLVGSRPNVDGDRLRLDGFISLAEGNRIRSVEILDQDAYVVGAYVRGDGAVAHYNVPPLQGTDPRDRLVQIV
ncbi:MAG: hypothetical protein ACR2GL_00645, partial [Thermoleophilaceae bacterium]